MVDRPEGRAVVIAAAWVDRSGHYMKAFGKRRSVVVVVTGDRVDSCRMDKLRVHSGLDREMRKFRLEEGVERLKAASKNIIHHSCKAVGSFQDT
jgi:hypothetical protein